MALRHLAALVAVSTASAQVPEACDAKAGQLITQAAGTISVGDYSRTIPLPPDYADCFWLVAAPNSSDVVTIDVDWVFVDPSPTCDDAYVFLFTVDGTRTRMLCWDDSDVPVGARALSTTDDSSMTTSSSSLSSVHDDLLPGSSGSTTSTTTTGDWLPSSFTTSGPTDGGGLLEFSAPGAVGIALQILRPGFQGAFGFSLSYRRSPADVPLPSPLPSPPPASASPLPPPQASATASPAASLSASASSSPVLALSQSSSRSHSVSCSLSASRSSVPQLPSPSAVPRASAPPSADSVATVVMSGPAGWSSAAPPFDTASQQLSDALGVPQYRFSAWQWDASSYPATVRVQILPPFGGVGSRALAAAAATGSRGNSVVGSGDAASSFEIVNEMLAQLADPSSALRQYPNSIFRSVSRATNTWAPPAAVSFTPSSIEFLVPYGRPRMAQPRAGTTVTNTGGSTLVISALSVVGVSSPYGVQMRVESPAAPISLPPPAFPGDPAASARITVLLDLSTVPASATQPTFALVSIDHNVPSGPHAVGLTVSIDGAPGPSPQQPQDPSQAAQSPFQSAGFKLGVGLSFGVVGLCAVAAGALVLFLRCRRRPGRPGSSAAGKSQLQSKGGGSGSGGGGSAGANAATSSAAAAEADSDAADDESDRAALTGYSSSSGGGRGAAAASSVEAAVEMVNLQVSAAAAASDAQQTAAAPASLPLLQLRAKPMLKATEFEPAWKALPTVELWGASLVAAPLDGELQLLLAQARFACMASGTVAGVSKYYFYAQQQQQDGAAAVGSSGAAFAGLCIVELSVTLASLRLSLVVKAATPALGERCAEVVKAALRDAAKLKEDP